MPAPVLLMTTICWPSVSLACWAIRREAISVVEPGASGTTSSIGRDGKFCAVAIDESARAAPTAMQATTALCMDDLATEGRKIIARPPRWTAFLDGRPAGEKREHIGGAAGNQHKPRMDFRNCDEDQTR